MQARDVYDPGKDICQSLFLNQHLPFFDFLLSSEVQIPYKSFPIVVSIYLQWYLHRAKQTVASVPG